MAEKTAPPAKVVSVLSDVWKFACDDPDQGVSRRYATADFDDSNWRKVATFSRSLDAQGLPDEKTILWFRNEFQVPDQEKRLSLVFMDVDGGATVFINGQQVGNEHPKRQLFEVDVTPHVRAGRNVIALRVDHRTISELFLGGIVRPIALVKRPAG
jgi:beta-galactosidase